MSQPFRVACVQNCATDDLAANLATAVDLVRAAAGARAELICLPEFFSNLEQSAAAYYDKGYGADTHPALPAFGALAREYSCWLLLGSIPIKASAGKVYNRSHLLAPDGGVVATYDKIHLFDVALEDGQSYLESASVVPGERAATAALPWGVLGLSICYDVRFPQLYRALAKAGADFISIPAAFTAKTGQAHWHTLVRARAIETGCFVFAPGQCGVRPWGRHTYGHSLIVDPWGEVLAEGGEEEGYIVADVDVARVAEVRRMIPALAHDRVFAPPRARAPA
jgi:deaminated glutathione amidase